MGPDRPPVYALEGSVAVAGVAMKWLKENLGLLKDIPTDSEAVRLEKKEFAAWLKFEP